MAATRSSTRYHPPRLAWPAAGRPKVPLQIRPQFAGLSRNELATRTGLHDHPTARSGKVHDCKRVLALGPADQKGHESEESSRRMSIILFACEILMCLLFQNLDPLLDIEYDSVEFQYVQLRLLVEFMHMRFVEN